MDEVLHVASEKTHYLAKEQRSFAFKEKQKMACILFNDLFAKYGGDAMKKKTKVLDSLLRLLNLGSK